jgi:hypothetical protein
MNSDRKCFFIDYNGDSFYINFKKENSVSVSWIPISPAKNLGSLNKGVICIMKSILLKVTSFLSLLVAAIHFVGYTAYSSGRTGSCNGIFNPISSGYGSDSIKSIIVEKQEAKPFHHDNIYCYRPKLVAEPMPVIFFLNSLGESASRSYDSLFCHIASRGYCLVHIVYRMKSFPFQTWTYNRMFKSCCSALDYFGKYIDTTRVGFMGHSFGAGAAPYLTLRLFNDRGWGSAGMFMYLFAPFFIFHVSQQELEQFPQQIKLIVQVYEEDDCVDHRMAKDLFESIGIPDSEKEFVILLSDSNAAAGCKLVADHTVPTNRNHGCERVDALDYYGVYRYFDALADYTFTGSEEAKCIAFGHGSAKQRFMGLWPDSTPVREALIDVEPPLVAPTSQFMFHWNHPWNFRRRRNDLWMPDSVTWKSGGEE